MLRGNHRQLGLQSQIQRLLTEKMAFPATKDFLSTGIGKSRGRTTSDNGPAGEDTACNIHQA